ncbi:MAG TPA: DUF1080 domain-containing protein [Blastocatellia bacterium]|nr:DUF1080 domain-containing protein [Blastocatellia bacterium]
MNLPARSLCGVALLGLGMACTALVGSAVDQSQPAMVEPKIIDPGPPGGPPSDAIVLFNGKDLSQWVGRDGGQAKWEVKDGVATVNHSGSITTKQEFGDAQLHVEWATPSQVKGEGQERGNSGVFLQSRYEVQVLDSYQNKTYFNGQAGAVYKQYVPLVNACRKPGEWQSYDIIFHAPAFNDAGEVVKRATMTVLHNGVLIQDNVQVLGTTTHEGEPRYTKHAPKAPLQLQDHGDPVRFRNIWIRPL